MSPLVKRSAIFSGPVPPPRQLEQYLRYFCGDANDPNALGDTEPLRVSFYKAATTLVH